MKKLFEIESDCLGILERLKAIDEDYFIVRNLDKNTFEVHNRKQPKNTYCLTIPYDVLDERTVSLVLKTRIQNSDEIFREIERENSKREKAVIKEVLNDFKEKLYDS